MSITINLNCPKCGYAWPFTTIDRYVAEALSNLKVNGPTDNTYHPLYKAWREMCINPTELKEIADPGAFANGMIIFLSYGTIKDFDTRQQIANLAYLFLSIAIEQQPGNINLYKNRVLLMINSEEEFRCTVQSATSSGGMGWEFMMGRDQLHARDILWKMMYTDINGNPCLCVIDPIASKKNFLDRKVAEGFFGEGASFAQIVKEGTESHRKVTEYLREKILRQEDLDF